MHLSVVISDDKLEDLEEANPFSFKEFLKAKSLGLSKEDTTDSRIYAKVNPRRSQKVLQSISLLTCSLPLEEIVRELWGSARQLLMLAEKLCRVNKLFGSFLALIFPGQQDEAFLCVPTLNI